MRLEYWDVEGKVVESFRYHKPLFIRLRTLLRRMRQEGRYNESILVYFS